MATRRGPDNSVRFAISGTQNGVAWANVFWAQLTTSGTPAQVDLDNWLIAAAAAYKTRFAPSTMSYASYTQAQAILFLPGGLSMASVQAMTGSGGAGASTVQAQELSSVISWITGVYWRGGKPRTYIPAPIVGNILTNRFLSATYITTLTTAATGFRTDINALTTGAISASVLGFVSFRSGNADRPTPLFFAFSGAKLHPRVGTQRRRMGKWTP